MPPAALEKCVEKVKKNSPGVNPYAVCAVSTGWVRKKGGGWRRMSEAKRALMKGKGKK